MTRTSATRQSRGYLVISECCSCTQSSKMSLGSSRAHLCPDILDQRKEMLRHPVTIALQNGRGFSNKKQGAKVAALRPMLTLLQSSTHVFLMLHRSATCSKLQLQHMTSKCAKTLGKANIRNMPSWISLPLGAWHILAKPKRVQRHRGVGCWCCACGDRAPPHFIRCSWRLSVVCRIHQRLPFAWNVCHAFTISKMM